MKAEMAMMVLRRYRLSCWPSALGDKDGDAPFERSPAGQARNEVQRRQFAQHRRRKQFRLFLKNLLLVGRVYPSRMWVSTLCP
ncbi:MAG: hypothetical protein IPG25_15715 [Proteobacteria bacterium]|nr:hypothetical protein [Pseudomonadota bacterium]